VRADVSALQHGFDRQLYLSTTAALVGVRPGWVWARPRSIWLHADRWPEQHRAKSRSAAQPRLRLARVSHPLARVRSVHCWSSEEMGLALSGRLPLPRRRLRLLVGRR